MKVETFYPQNSILREHIEYYYFLKTNSSDFNDNYYAFPNTLQSLNIHKNAECEIKPHFTGVFESTKNNYLTIVQGRYELPLLVNLKGKLDKVTIIFKPLGLNHFINSSFKQVAGTDSQVFTEWESLNYKKFLYEFYKIPEQVKRVDLLEDFLLTQYQSFKEAETLQIILDRLTDFDNEYSIEEIAASLSINPRTLSRLFNKHLGISPIGFKKIARFRHSLKNKIFSDQLKTLTEIGYESNFYDQAYFVKIYKSLTGNNPSKFFNSIEKLADNQLIFEFINK